jgi:hypothetical protein
MIWVMVMDAMNLLPGVLNSINAYISQNISKLY